MVPRILVVDDSEDTVTSCAALLRAVLKCEVRTCTDSTQCVELAKEFAPHVVLLDLAMPHRDGFAIAKDLRETELCFDLIAVTGFTDEKTRMHCDEAGFDGYLVKPTPLEALRHLVENARKRIVEKPAATERGKRS